MKLFHCGKTGLFYAGLAAFALGAWLGFALIEHWHERSSSFMAMAFTNVPPPHAVVRGGLVLSFTALFAAGWHAWRARKRVEARLTYINALLSATRRVHQILMRETDRQRLVEGVCQSLVGNLGYHSAWIMVTDEQGEVAHAAVSGDEASFAALEARYRRGDAIPCISGLDEAPEELRCLTPSGDCGDCPMRPSYRDSCSNAVKLQEGATCWGYLSVSAPSAYGHDVEAQALLVELGRDIGAALTRIAKDEGLWLRQEILASIGDCVTVTDPSGKIVYVNEALAQSLGRSVEDLIGQPVHVYGENPDQGVTQDAIIEAVYAHGAWEGEVTNYTADSRELIVESRVWLMRDATGRPRYLCGVGRDITARKQAEAYTQWLAIIAEHSPNICVVKDLNLRVLAANRAFAEAAGKASVAELIGKTDLEILGDKPSVRQYMADERAVQRLPQGDALSKEETLVLPDGTERTLFTRKFPVYGDDGQLVATANISVDLTEQRESEMQMRAMADRLKRLSDRVPGFIYQYRQYPDGSSCFPWASEGVRDIYEVTPEELSNDASKVFERLHPDDYAGIVDSIQHSFDRLAPWRHECRVCLPKRGVRWLSGNAVPERLEDGSVLWYGHIHDITSRKEDERRIRQLTERLQVAVKSAQVGIYELDLVSGEVYVDDTIYHLYGVNREELPPSLDAWNNLVHPDDRERAANALPGILAGDRDYSIEFRVVRPSGAVCHMKSFGTVQRDAAGTPLRIIGTNWDITELKEREQAIRESEQRFRSLLEYVPNVAVQGFDAEGTIHYWNEASERFYGYTAREALGANLVDLIIPPEARDEVQERIRASAATGDPIPAGELALMRRDGSIARVFSSHAVVRTPGLPVSLYCLDIDLTEYKRLEEQLRHAQKMEAVGQLAGGIAHDFNNMLSAILGNTQLAQDLVPHNADDLLEHLREVERAAQRAAALTRQLLLYSRRQVLTPEVLDLNAVIEDLLKMIRRTIGEHIELEFVPAGQLDAVSADRGQVEQVVVNLCVNARDAMPGGGRLTLATRNFAPDEAYCRANPWARPGHFAAIYVTDTGVGMDAETLEHIFDPFFTTKEVGKGTGLGLATVYGIVKQHQGLIAVESAPGAGSRFEVCFPRVEKPAHLGETKKDNTRPPGGHERILLAEDDDAIRQLAQRILERAGYRVTVARDGRDAIHLLEEQPRGFDLALLDVVMPHEGGGAVAHHIQDNALDVRILFMSGYSGSLLYGDLLDGFEAPMIHKPFGPVVLLGQVRAVLDGTINTADAS